MSKGNGRIKRLLAGSVVGLTGLAFAPGTAGAVVDTADFCAAAADFDTGFTDIDAAGVHEDNVVCLAFSEITAGTTATTYSPQNNVTRGQMATFIANMIDTANELDAAGAPDLADLPEAADAADAFTDDEGNTHEDNINRLAEAGVVAGTSATTFEPNANVSRAQMASFIAQAVEFLTGEALDEGTDAFTDDETSVHEANINRLATAEIVGGIGGGLYNPSGLVSRAQMGSFLIQGLAALHADGIIDALEGGPQESNADFPSDVSGAQIIENPASGLGTLTATFEVDSSADLTVALVPCMLVNDDNGYITLADYYDGAGEFFYTGDSNASFWAGESGMNIAEINGVDQPADTMWTDTVDGVDPINAAGGEVSVRVESDDEEADCAYIFIWDDSGTSTDDADGYLEMADADNAPTEPFGAVGPIVFHEGEAPNGEGPDDYVLWVDKANDFFVTADDFFYNYDADDEYAYDSDGDDFNVSFAEWENWLSQGDEMLTDVNEYSRTAENYFELNEDGGYPGPVPTNTTATTGDFDDSNADTGANDVRVTFDPIDESMNVAYYCVDRYTTNGTTDNRDDDTYQTYECGVEANGDDDEDGSVHEVVFENVPQGTYFFYVYACTNDDCQPYSVEEAPTTVGAAPVGSPWSMTATFQDLAPIGLVSVDDILTVTFSEPMAAAQNGDALTLQDADGTTGNVVCGTNATCSFDGGGTILTVTLTGAPQISQAGDTAGLAYPAEVVAQGGTAGGFTDGGGLAWDLAMSPDTTF